MKKTITIFIILAAIAAGIFWFNRPEVQAPIIDTPATVGGDIPVPTTDQQKLVLEQDGLDAINFGAAPEETIAAISAVLGTPTKDTGVVESFSKYGTCPGDTVRGVEWKNFYVLFGDTVWGKNKFYGYGYTDIRDAEHISPLYTAKGVTIGMSAAEMKEKYPKATIGEWLPGQKAFTLERGASHDGRFLAGTLIDDKIYFLSGGIMCGE